MEKVFLNAKTRQQNGTSAAKKMRAGGAVPAIVYANKENPVQISVDQKELIKLVHKHGENSIINMKLDNAGKVEDKTVIIKDMQVDNVRNSVIHVDFQFIKMTEKIRVSVPLHTKGDDECIGVKEGGILEHVLHEIEVESLPGNMPKEILVDVSSLKVGESIHVSDLNAGPDVRIVDNPEQVAVLVKYETAAEEKTGEEGDQESSNEPEVIKKGKTEETES